jgi:hypothetical protein
MPTDLPSVKLDTGLPMWESDLESPGFAQNFGSCGEVEGLHLVGVLTFDDEFREDVGLVGTQQKFWKALA